MASMKTILCRMYKDPATEREVTVGDPIMAADVFVHNFFGPMEVGAVVFVEVFEHDKWEAWDVECIFSTDSKRGFFTKRTTVEEIEKELAATKGKT